ncbi:MAG: hypothetical protein V2A54_05695 [Bacteroidota bacterium]
MKKHLFFLILLFVLPGMMNHLYAQKQKPLRVEFETKRTSNNYNIVPIGKEGVLLFYDDDEKTKEGRKWIVTKYNTDLKEVWSEDIAIPGAVDFIKYYYDEAGKQLYIMLGRNRKYASEAAFMTNNKGDFAILTVDVKDGKSKSVTGKLDAQTGVMDFKVLNGRAYISGWKMPPAIAGCFQGCFTYTCIPTLTGVTMTRLKPFAMSMDVESGKENVQNFNFKKHSFAVGSQIDNKKGEPGVVVFIKNRPDKKSANAYLYRYNSDGEEVQKLALKTKGNKILNNAKFYRVNDKESIIIGTYDNLVVKLRNPMSPYSTGYTNEAVGLYFAKFTDEAQDYIQFYPFSKFEDLFSYMNAKRKTKLDKKMDKAKKKGKAMDIQYSLLVHDIIPRKDHFIMVAEAYYPQYHYEYYTTYVNGKMQTEVRRVFDGYRYTHALVAGFDKEGELLFNNSFEVWDILTFNLKERVKVMPDGDNIILTYSTGGAISSKIVSGNSVIEGKTETKIETMSEDDKVKSNWSSDMDFWYDNYFITYGYQRIKDKKQKQKRTVFYFNKIGFE